MNLIRQFNVKKLTNAGKLYRYLFIFFCLVPLQFKANPYPISLMNGLLVSEAVIEGKTVLVIFDTGSPGLVLNSRYYSQDETSGIPCEGINGSFDCHTHQVKTWTWMDTNHKNTNALLSDLSFLENSLHKEVHALIGLSVLEDFYVTLDFDQMSITLSEKMKLDSKSIIRFQYVDHLPVITCKVNGQKKILGLDTGSEVNYLFSFKTSDDHNLLANAYPVMVVGTENINNLKYCITMDINLMNDQVYNSEFVIDLPTQQNFQNDSFDGFLGLPFLSRYNITFQPKKQILILSPRENYQYLPKELASQF